MRWICSANRRAFVFSKKLFCRTIAECFLGAALGMPLKNRSFRTSTACPVAYAYALPDSDCFKFVWFSPSLFQNPRFFISVRSPRTKLRLSFLLEAGYFKRWPDGFLISCVSRRAAATKRSDYAVRRTQNEQQTVSEMDCFLINQPIGIT